MARKKKELIEYTCDLCKSTISKTDELALIDTVIPALVESIKTGKQRWQNARTDLCAECAQKHIKLRGKTEYFFD